MKNKIKSKPLILLCICLIIPSFLFFKYGRSIWHPTYLKLKGKRTVNEVISIYGEQAESRLQSKFKKSNLQYPPDKIAFITFKDEKVLHAWAAMDNNPFRFVHSYRIKGASGTLGPKLKEGDRQVPEGIYKIEGLNPNSSYHLSMKLNYPNPFDLKYAKIEGRTDPGSNIFIHGKSGSVGCLAMGDRTIEELFVLSNRVGLRNIEVIIAPTNLVANKDVNGLLQNKPFWVEKLYDKIRSSLQKYYKM